MSQLWVARESEFSLRVCTSSGHSFSLFKFKVSELSCLCVSLFFSNKLRSLIDLFGTCARVQSDP